MQTQGLDLVKHFMYWQTHFPDLEKTLLLVPHITTMLQTACMWSCNKACLARNAADW
jgi:hypothetical protein